MFNKIKSFLLDTVQRIYKILSNTEYLISIYRNDIKNPKVTTGRMIANFNNQLTSIKSLHDVEFQVFSQWGDDGIIQYLINRIDIENKTFVEFGVQDYTESNTRFLLINNNWSGLVIDGSAENIDYVKNDIISWGYEIYAKQAFITKENINTLLQDLPFGQKLGILSIDIDGNDYWVWKEISVVDPIIVIVEYNSLFGQNNPWTIPYNPTFVRDINDYNILYWGTSLTSICDLAETKGYGFVGCNSAGNNAYFVRKDKLSNLPTKTVNEGFVMAKFRESVDENGRVGGKLRQEKLKGKIVHNTRTDLLEEI